MLSVSVIIPVYNRSSMIGQAISSALHQTYPPLEILVIDDASTDDTLSTLEVIARSHPSVKVLASDKNGGPSAARNHGLAKVRGDLVAFLDSDDLWESNHLESCVGYFVDSPDLTVVFDDIRVVDGHGRTVTTSVAREMRQIDRFIEPLSDSSQRFRFRVPEFEAILGCYFLGIQSALVRRGSASMIGFEPSLRIGEDVLFFSLIAFRGSRFGFVDQVGCTMRLHDGNLISNNKNQLNATLSWARAYQLLDSEAGLTARMHQMIRTLVAKQFFEAAYISRMLGDRLNSLRYLWKSLRARPTIRACRGLFITALIPSAVLSRRSESRNRTPQTSH